MPIPILGKCRVISCTSIIFIAQENKEKLVIVNNTAYNFQNIKNNGNI